MSKTSTKAVSKAPAEPLLQDPTAGSVHDQARLEAEKHKWLESEKHGCDVGPQAIEDWYRHFWGKYAVHDA